LLVNHQLIVSTPTVLHEGVPGDAHPGAAVLLAPRIGRSRAFSMVPELNKQRHLTAASKARY
jgi:hypothetical protein